MDESVVKVFEEQQVGTLKLSAAIRIGSKFKPQGKWIPYANAHYSCAIGAAMEALYGERRGFDDAVRLCGSMELHDDIVRRNDELGWTREQIADWLGAQGY